MPPFGGAGPSVCALGLVLLAANDQVTYHLWNCVSVVQAYLTPSGTPSVPAPAPEETPEICDREELFTAPITCQETFCAPCECTACPAPVEPSCPEVAAEPSCPSTRYASLVGCATFGLAGGALAARVPWTFQPEGDAPPARDESSGSGGEDPDRGRHVHRGPGPADANLDRIHHLFESRGFAVHRGHA